MSTPLRPPLATTHPCFEHGCSGMAVNRDMYCAECKRAHVLASKRKYQKKWHRNGPKRVELFARLERIESLLTQLVALGGERKLLERELRRTA